MSKVLWINDIKLDGKDEFTINFNRLSDIWSKVQDESLTKEERDKELEYYIHCKQCMEMGMNF
jgi:hypothetical protein